MDKKIGLEHTIREVMNKPADSNESKVGLEHAIRNVMTESIGGPNTDKFKGTPPSFLRPIPTIKPKVGDAHPDGTVAITQRGKDKIKSSETMKEEEQLDEYAAIGKAVGGLVAKYGDDAAKMVDDFFKKAPPVKTPKKPEYAPLPPQAPPGNLPVPVKPQTPVAPAAPKPVAPSPAPAAPKPVAPSPAPAAPKPVAPSPAPAAPKPTAPAPTVPATKPTAPAAPKPTAPAPATKPVTKTKTSTKTKTAAAVAAGLAVGATVASKIKDLFTRRGGIISPPGMGDTSGGSAAGSIDVGTYRHTAAGRRGDRFNEQIDPGAAETIKTKTRKAQIIRKVIDEQKKKKETSTVILNPKLKHQEADQN
jgi:hypothetical protein